MNDEHNQGWTILKQLNELLTQASSGTTTGQTSVMARRMLASYMQMPNMPRPSKLHSAFLASAVRMALMFTDFHLVPFLDLWGLQNLRPEDSEAYVDANGKRFPSTVERLAKAYAYSMLFRPKERLETALESLIFPFLEKRGYVMSATGEVDMGPLLATRTFTSDVRGRKMTFVTLIDRTGTSLTTEVHTLTQYQRLRYEDIPGMLFRALLRRTDKGLRIEAAILQPADAAEEDETFRTIAGYVEYIDHSHNHIHVYDNHSRHFVANLTPKLSHIVAGQYVRFIPVVPKDSTFKSAFIRAVYPSEQGPEAFGYRRATITYIDNEKGYAAWELLAGEAPIVELISTLVVGKGGGAVAPSGVQPSFTKGYIQGTLFKDVASQLEVGKEVRLITFLKRGKDRQKRPFVVSVHVL